MEKIYTSHLYETDFYDWTQKQVSLLKTQQWDYTLDQTLNPKFLPNVNQVDEQGE
ncbi:MAG: hypothetical protein V7K89_14295 [Nostoc sp.]|uniref:hypothetical protein n=1 Tax=Nostoc sp. TaxID=1180 RepID=UPI002FFA9593